MDANVSGFMNLFLSKQGYKQVYIKLGKKRLILKDSSTRLHGFESSLL